MSLLRTVPFVVASFVYVTGCSSSGSGNDNTQVIQGKLSGGSTSAQTFGGIDVQKGTSGLHVTAREVHKKGAVGKSVDTVVDANGQFTLHVERGSRYVVLVESSDKKSAIISLGNGNDVISVGANGNGASVDLGRVQVVGGEGRASVSIDGATGVHISTAEIGDVFEDAAGAIRDAQEAVAEAQKAAEQAILEAQQAAANAQQAADAARKAAEAAQQAAGK